MIKVVDRAVPAQLVAYQLAASELPAFAAAVASGAAAGILLL